MEDHERPTVPAYRTCDRRYPFLWTSALQPAGRWHDRGEGPCHDFATTAKGAWAEVVRHEEITDLLDLLDLERSLWGVEVVQPEVVPMLGEEILTGGVSSYPACRAEAHRLRAGGATGLRAPSAAVRSGRAPRTRLERDAQVVTEAVPTEVLVVWGDPHALTAMPLAEGHPDPNVLDDVRPL
jgi:hypothetical protein